MKTSHLVAYERIKKVHTYEAIRRWLRDFYETHGPTAKDVVGAFVLGWRNGRGGTPP
jgi:hypothetical protein